jgi:predicted aspartyl protease
MKFSYTKLPDNTEPKGYVLVPQIRVSLFYKGNRDDIRCLLDTGANDCIFHSSIAANLGIDLTSGKPKTYFGADLHPFQAYLHTVELQIHNYHERILVEAGFSDDCPLSLLGQKDFFDNYEVTFRRYRNSFEIKSRTHIR